MAIKTPDRAAFWRHHLENFRSSGLTRSAYCREHRLKVHQLAYQLDRASKATCVMPGLLARTYANIRLG